MGYTFTQQDHSFMRVAMEEAKAARDHDEVPVGAVIVNADGHMVAHAGNRTRILCNPAAHAEILVIREACKKAGAQRIPGYTVYVTLEPCAMCAAAIAFARIERVVFGALDPKGGGILHGGQFYTQATCHHKPVVEHGLMAEECGRILKDFFKQKRGL